jgi:hypothetical protein
MPTEIEQICRTFEQAWARGESPLIETLLPPGEPAVHIELLPKLLRIEIKQRLRRGDQLTITEYLKRFPECDSVVQGILSPTLLPDETLDVQPGVQGDTTDFSFALMSQPMTEDPGSGLVPSPATPSRARQSIGRYTVIGMLGRGGQADVYRAVHPTLPMEVAIKLTHTLLPESARAALLVEAHILCDLDHPHIARVRDFDFEDGRPYMVLDFIRGRSLSQVASAEPFSPVAAATVVAKIARAIGFAHSAGVIHRDLKPENVVMEATGEPKIIDFGVSRLRSGMVSDTEERNEISGTLAYMAPEQAAGIAENIDHRVDVFALGAILYRLLVGQAPYDSQPLAIMMATVRQGTWNVHRLASSPIPEELKAICRRAMSHAPDQRYRNAESLAAALDDYVATATRDQSVGAMAEAAVLPNKRSWMVPAVILGGAICAVMLGVLSLADPFALRSDRSGGKPPTIALPEAASALIKEFELVHIGNSEERAEFSGSLLQHRSPQENDDIQIRAEFSEPIYCFLIAFNPDGVKQLCYPRESGVAQMEPIQTLRYPTSADSAFGLTDGAGQQAFILYASREPLPAFRSWQNELVAAQWPTADITGNWLYESGELLALADSTASSPLTRGVERRTKTPTPFKAWCDALRQSEISDVRGVTFSIQPKI